ADNANDLTRWNAETDVMQRLRPIDAITKCNVVEQHVATHRRQRGAAGTKGLLGRRIEDVAEALDGKAGLMEILPHLGKAEHRSTHPPCKDIECHQLADRQRTIDHEPGAKI